jgi:hypothetical protein
LIKAIYDNNFRSLASRFPALAKLVAGRSGGGVSRAANGEATLTLEGFHVHSPRDPGREARRLAENIELPEGGGGALVLLGFGLGYTASALTTRFLAEKRAIPLLIVEKRAELFRAALENVDLTGLFSYPPLVFVLGDDPNAVIAGLEAVKKTGVVIKNRALCEIDRDYYDEAERVIETWASKDKINSATLEKFGKLFERNQKKNAPLVKQLPGVKETFGRFRCPVLLVAAGPSLDELSPVIKRLSESALVVACDTALRFLARHDVTPRFAVSADAQFWNYLHIAGLSESYLRNITLVADTSVHPLILRAAFGRRYVFTTQGTARTDVADKGTLRAGGSVATSAWDFACAIGASEIRVAGLDLAFPDFRTHYKGAVFEERSHNTATRFRPAETQSAEALRSGAPFYAPSASGGKVLTDRRMRLYADWFEAALRDKNAPTTYSLSKNGLAIRGINTLSTD